MALVWRLLKNGALKIIGQAALEGGGIKGIVDVGFRMIAQG